ncbi:hypothetical protein LRAMOSA03905 [Lichtheimia ramosa]|uniref:Golgi apyrase n=1 Tax=Lichtheimia ramosa TaxID=688394 RepID=A0A077WXW1_9FUNG|nr:hypothetical protein LRAMOSA03905 [Lichtheimia ramosa]
MTDHVLQKRQTAFEPRQEATLDKWAENRHYGVVVDAGSSGSRVYVYSWEDFEHTKSSLLPVDLRGRIPVVERGDAQGLKWTRREEPGISTYGSRPQEVSEHLKPLLDFAAEVVPVDQQSSTPLFLMATAGMRLLPEEERHAVLNASCNYIRDTYSFAVDDCDQQIRVISGEDEGIYGWVAVNYLMGGFDMSVTNTLNSHHTFGFLDMGGASAQIAFEPEHHQREAHSDDLRTIVLHTLDGQQVEYDVFVTTFLGYGSNEARRRYLEERVKDEYMRNADKNLLDEHRTLHLDDPCLPPQLNVTDTLSTSIPLTLHGTGSFSECMDATAPLLNKNADCPTQPCLFNGVHTPEIDWSVNKFVGISEYWYSSHDLLDLGGVYDFAEYEQKATDYCARPWNNDDTNESVEIHHRQMQCFKSAWIVNVLHDGIGIPRITDPAHGSLNVSDDAQLLEQSIDSIEAKNWNPPFQSIDTINDIQVSWTLGAMVMHVAKQIPLVGDAGRGHATDHDGLDNVSTKEKLWSPLMANSSTILLVLMFLMAFFLWWLYYKRSGRKRRTNMQDTGGILGLHTPSDGIDTNDNNNLHAWMSRSRSAPPLNDIDENEPSSNDTVTIQINGTTTLQSSNSSNSNPPPSNGNGFRSFYRPMLGPSTLSPSAFSMKYWSKKRYSGDSHDTLFGTHHQTNHVPLLRSASSASNLANRLNNNNNSNVHTQSTTTTVHSYLPN